MTEMTEGMRLLREAAALGPEEGHALLSKTLSGGGNTSLCQEFLAACTSFHEPGTGDFRPDTPADIVALAEYIRVTFMGGTDD